MLVGAASYNCLVGSKSDTSCKTAILVRTDAYKSLILLRSLNPAPGTNYSV